MIKEPLKASVLKKYEMTGIQKSGSRTNRRRNS